MIIFGTRGVTYQYAAGDFFCPTCNANRDFKHRRVRRFFTLYFIPVIPLDLLGEYVECADCLDTYKPAVLAYDPAEADMAFEAEFHVAIRRVMVMMMLADGVIDDDEIETIRLVYAKLAGVTLTGDAVRAEAKGAEAEGGTIEEYLSGVVGSLNEHGKELVLKSALLVAMADGDFAVEERELIEQIGEAMEMSPAHVKGVLAEASGS